MSAHPVDSSGKPTVISTFAGCGGSSLGYHMAGFRELLAVEWDNNAVETFKRNFKDVPVYHGDIAKLSVDECLSLTGIQKGELDLFDGSPPCQGFSTAGKRELKDDRNQLFREYCRLLNGLQPKCFVMENVTGMVKGHMKQVYLEIVKELRACGYRVKGQVLNAMYYGVPQSRERVIIIGVRNDLGIEPTHPKPTHRPKTVREAIAHLTHLENKTNHKQSTLDAWKACGYNRSLRHANKYVGSFQSYRLHPDMPSPTQIKSQIHWHYDVPRKLTIKEVSIIQSFPERFVWSGNKTNDKERIGNSVPPLLSKAIGEHLIKTVINA
jgi:DNA (cytosine-5)-methyltransferase 1